MSAKVTGTVSLTAPKSRAQAAGRTSVVGTVHVSARAHRAFASASEVTRTFVEVTGYLPAVAVRGTLRDTGVVRGTAPAPPAVDITGTATVIGRGLAVAPLATSKVLGISTLLGVVDCGPPLPRTNVPVMSTVFGHVDAWGHVPETQVRDYHWTWYLMVVGDQPPFDMGDDPNGRAQYAFNITTHKLPSFTHEEELSQYLTENGITDPILLGSASAIPPGDALSISLVRSGGYESLRVQNYTESSISRPSVQVTVRAGDGRLSRDRSYEIYSILTAIRNQELVVPKWAEL